MRSSFASLRRLVQSRPSAGVLRSQSRLHSSLRRPQFAPRTLPVARAQSFQSQRRHESSLTYQGDQKPQNSPARDEPAYELTFTCKPCLYRSSHRITKHGYHYGTVLITCPSCNNRHVISDHLKIFMDAKSTLEDILRQKLADGEDLTKLLKRGKLGIRQDSMVGNEGEEDLEFWEDGTETKREPEK